MSKAARIADADRTAIMLDLLRREKEDDQRGMSLSTVVLEEVSPGVGFSSVQRWADVLALGIWRSKGQRLDGYEIKASKADLKKELSDLTKHQALARYCDSWTLLAWDESVLVEGIPESWGIVLTKLDANMERVLTRKRPAQRLTPEPWPRSFVCSLVRNAYQQSAGAAFVARACDEMRKRFDRDHERVRKDMTHQALRPIAQVLFGRDSWKWPPEAFDPEQLAAIVAERIAQGILAEASA